MSLRNKEVVLAGGAGGLGSALASLLLAEGARVILSHRGADVPGSSILQADLSHARDRARLLDAAPALYGLVVLVGDPARVSNSADMEAAMLRSHQSNYFGPILLAREAAERMKAASTPGAVVLVSTMQANALFPGSTAYAAQKAALQHAARILAKECRGPGEHPG